MKKRVQKPCKRCKVIMHLWPNAMGRPRLYCWRCKKIVAKKRAKEWQKQYKLLPEVVRKKSKSKLKICGSIQE